MEQTNRYPSHSVNQISQNTARILKEVKQQLASQENLPENKDTQGIPNRIRLSEALQQGTFSDVGMNMYKSAAKNEDYGRIWVKKTFIDDKTGEKEDWLVVYTNDEDEIIRQLASEKLHEMRKVASIEKKAEATFTKFDTTTNWVKGKVGKYTFEAKLFDEPSEYGINEGRVSKLVVWDKNKGVISFDRGWDIEPAGEDIHAFEEIMQLLENSPKRFSSIISSQKTSAQPDPKNIPIAPGIKSKDLKLNESGGAGTGTVTIEFTDVNKALKFYQEEVTPSGGEKEAPKEEEGVTPQEGNQPTPPPIQPQVAPQVQPKASSLKQASSENIVPGAGGSLIGIGGFTIKDRKYVDGKYKDEITVEFDDGSQEIMPIYKLLQSGNIQWQTKASSLKQADLEGQAEDQFGQYLSPGDRVRDDEGDLKGEVLEVGNFFNGNVRVKWDNGYEEDLPSSILTKWSNLQSTVSEFSKGMNGVKVIRYAREEGSHLATPWELSVREALGSHVNYNYDKYSFINENGIEIPIILPKNIKVGEMFERPDTHELCHFAGFIEKKAENEGLEELSAGDEEPEGEASLDIHIEAEPKCIDKMIDDIIKGIDFDEDELEGGKADDMSDEMFDEDELEKGVEHEKEHTDDEEIAKEIAKDHIGERKKKGEDEDYYEDLDKMEEENKEGSKKKSSYWDDVGETWMNNERYPRGFLKLKKLRNYIIDTLKDQPEFDNSGDYRTALITTDKQDLLDIADKYNLKIPNKISKIVHENGKWVVKNEAGTRTLGTHSTKEDAEKQLQAIEINKNSFIDKKSYGYSNFGVQVGSLSTRLGEDKLPQFRNILAQFLPEAHTLDYFGIVRGVDSLQPERKKLLASYLEGLTGKKFSSIEKVAEFNSLLEIRDRREEITDPDDLGYMLSESDLQELLANPQLYDLSEGELKNIQIRLDRGNRLMNYTASQRVAVSPPGRKHEVEELKEKGVPEEEAFAIAWSQYNEKGKPKKEPNIKLSFDDIYDTQSDFHNDQGAYDKYLNEPENELKPEVGGEYVYEFGDMQDPAFGNKKVKVTNIREDTAGVGGKVVDFVDLDTGKESTISLDSFNLGFVKTANEGNFDDQDEFENVNAAGAPQKTAADISVLDPEEVVNMYEGTLQRFEEEGEDNPEESALDNVAQYFGVPSLNIQEILNKYGSKTASRYIEEVYPKMLPKFLKFIQPNTIAQLVAEERTEFALTEAVSDFFHRKFPGEYSENEADIFQRMVRRDFRIGKIAADISDEVPPATWTTDESKSDTVDPNTQAPLPPKQELNNAPGDVLYDSNKEQKGQGKFQVTTDPSDKTVTVKFIDEEKALDQAINEGAGVKPQPFGQQPPLPPPGQNPQQTQFQDTNSQVTF